MVRTHAIEGSNPRHSTMRVWPSGEAPGRQPGQRGPTPLTRSTEGCPSPARGHVANVKPGGIQRGFKSLTLRHAGKEDGYEQGRRGVGGAGPAGH